MIDTLAEAGAALEVKAVLAVAKGARQRAVGKRLVREAAGWGEVVLASVTAKTCQ